MSVGPSPSSSVEAANTSEFFQLNSVMLVCIGGQTVDKGPRSDEVDREPSSDEVEKEPGSDE